MGEVTKEVLVNSGDLNAAVTMLTDLCAPMTDMVSNHAAVHFANHRTTATASKDAEIAELRERAKGPAAWLERWAQHVGSCTGKQGECTCGLELARHELDTLLNKGDTK